MKISSEDRPPYGSTQESTQGDTIIAEALQILAQRMRAPGDFMSAPADVKNFVRLKLAGLEHEVFAVMWLDTQNRLLKYDEMFRGTLTQTPAYPRELVKQALQQNAASAILVHNHPSGACIQSRADEMITASIKSALALIDVRVLDHIIVGGVDTMSFAERGLM